MPAKKTTFSTSNNTATNETDSVASLAETATGKPKAPPKPIYLFFGDDLFSSYQKLNFWQKEFSKKFDESSLEILDGKKMDVKDFSTNINSLPFLSEKRMIVIKNFLDEGKKDNQKFVADSLEDSIDSCIIIFHETEAPEKSNPVYKKIAKIGTLQEFPKLSLRETYKWIVDKAKKDNIKISLSTADYLSQYCKPELWSLNNELEKLQLYANGQEITPKMIDDLCIQSLTASVFKLTDSIAEKNQKGAIKSFQVLCDSGEDPNKVFFMIIRQFRILLQVKDLMDRGERELSIVKKLALHPFVVKKSLYQCKNFPAQTLAEIYKKLLHIDKGVKTGRIKSYQGDNSEFELAIERVILDCCKK
ncbi:MAG: DNA polymerase III subunit delta [Patescibacteria group bacterium]